MYSTGPNGYKNFLFFFPIFSSLILDNNKKVAHGMSTGIASEKITPFDTNLEPTMSNLANRRVTLQFANCFRAKKFFFIV